MQKAIWLSMVLLIGCSSAEKRFNFEIDAGRCESALEKIPENTIGAKLLSKTQNASGVALSYAMTGAAYTGEVLLDIVGGTVMLVVICAPAVAVGVIEETNHGQFQTYGACIPERIDALFVPALGKKTFAASKDLRCPDLAGLSRSIRRVASCFSSRNETHSFDKASKALAALQHSERFYECLPEDEQKQIANDVNLLNLKKTKL